MVQPKPSAVNMEPNDASLGNGRKRSRRNAIKPNSADAIALMEFSVQYQLSNVSMEPPEGQEPSKRARESSSDEEESVKESPGGEAASVAAEAPSSSMGDEINSNGNRIDSIDPHSLVVASMIQEVIPSKSTDISPVAIDEVLVTVVPFTSAPCTPTAASAPSDKIEAQPEDS
eukprot:gene41606-50772_t